MIALILLLVWMLPVLPIARRLAWYIKEKQALQTPERKVTRGIEYGYVYINDHITTVGEVCQNCGGDKDYHRGGAYRTIMNTSKSRYACDNYKPWDRKRDNWPAQKVYNISDQLAMHQALGLTIVGWPAILATILYNKMVHAHVTGFALPPPSERSRVEAEQLQARLDTLQADIAKREKELGIGQSDELSQRGSRSLRRR